MTQGRSTATVEIEASGITVEAGSRWFGGSTEGVLRWRLPSSGHELLRALLWDEWLLDDHPGQTDCTTIEPDEVDGFDLDGGSEHPRRWADGSAASSGATDDHHSVRAWVRIEELDRISIHAEGREQAVDSSDALAEWLDHAFGPFELPEAFQEWELPDLASLGLVVVSHEPDPTVVSSAAWRMLIRATGLPAELRHEALDLNLVLVPPARHLMSVADRLAGVSRRVVPAADPFYVAVPRPGRGFGPCPGFARPTATQWSLAIEAANVWRARAEAPRTPRWEQGQPCPTLVVAPSLDPF